MRTQALSIGMWGVDTDVALTPAQAIVLSRTFFTDPSGVKRKLSFIYRYASLAAPAPTDITAPELQGYTGAGLLCGVIQHCYNVGWTASGGLGQAMGASALYCAQKAGYPEGACIGMDLEGVGNVGLPVFQCCVEWAGWVVQRGNALAQLYNGFQCGLSAQELWDIPDFHQYWGAPGATIPAVRGHSMKQVYENVTLPGLSMKFDINVVVGDAMKQTPILAAA